MKKEVWKPVVGYEGLYEVSDQGRVRSLNYRRTGKVQILKPGFTRRYLLVSLLKDGEKKHFLVHRLVALAFIPNDDPEHKTQCNHINEDRLDNRACNLNWMTPKENTNWGTGIERCHQKQINKHNSKPVKQLTIDGTLICIWSSAMEAQRNGFFQSKVCSCCQGLSKTHKGYKWQYA